MKDENYNSTDTQQANRGIVICVPPWLALLLVIVACVTIVVAAFLVRNTGASPGLPSAALKPDATNAPPASSSPKRSRPGNPGPWGQLEYIGIAIERPDEFVYTRQAAATDHQTRWFFEGLDSEQLSALFRSTPGLTAAQQSILMNPANWENDTNGIYVLPPRALIFELARPAREKLYSILADSEANPFHSHPFSFYVSDAEEWFEHSGLSAETLDLLHQLLYQRGQTLCFSDLPDLEAVLPSKQERRRLMKTLSRQPSILMKLHVGPDTDVDALVGYWGKGGRAKDIRPLLESLTRVPGGTAIDIAHILPPFARMHLYSFPYPSTDPVVSRRNCFWTALNFFNERPDDSFCDAEMAQQAIQEHYYPIQDEPTYGDVVFLLDDREAVVHAAVYLADDMVFTKNGRSFTEPWRIMSATEMVAEYPSNTPIRPVIFRMKKL